MQNVLQGTFHFHSTYSHDGKSTLGEIAAALGERGLSFCIMTDHFEDFDAPKFARYVEEANAVTQSTGFILVPGVEVHLSGVDTILFPVREFEEIARFASEGHDSGRWFKVLAHPTKYSFEAVAKHLAKYQINAVEMWNQQADSSYIPPLRFLEFLRSQSWRNHYHYFFGSDLHNVKLTVSNTISLAIAGDRTAGAVVQAIIQGDFVSQNGPTGIQYCNGPARTELDTWLETVVGRAYYRGKILRSVRTRLRSFYKMLPRDLQHSLNDIKNFVRNKV